MRASKRRARLALWLALWWIVGFELGPSLHVAMHDQLAAHHHTDHGTVYDDVDPEVDEHVAAADASDHGDHDVDAEVDEHAADTGDHDRSHHHQHGTPDPDARLAAALAHGAHSLEHHGIAVPVPAPALTRPLPVDRRPRFVAVARELAPRVTPVVPAVARGPPRSLV